LVLAVACTHQPPQTASVPSAAATQPVTTEAAAAQLPADPHSWSHPAAVRSRHLGLTWTIDFEHKRLEGSVVHVIERLDKTAPLRLDTRGLDIERVELGTLPHAKPGDPEDLQVAELGASAGWQAAKWSRGESDPILGRALVVELEPDRDLVRIHYRTSEDATGLQWLAPEQTADGTHPFLYSQAQAIHARSFVPIQDSPGVRITYDAVVRADPELQALMAAERLPGETAGTHRFRMAQAIPPYLMAVAAGRLEFAPLGERSGVWAEPVILPKAKAEFADVERMMTTAEQLYGPYRWGRYDILVLPPAFPFGGMENPRLTFATPTILAGDRSLVALIAHELAHSWSGNLVTNATWADLWLNEGFTVYIERRIVEALFGSERADMEAVLGRQDLDKELASVPDEDEKLAADLRGRDPDEGLSNVPYEKGALFLHVLEQTYGRDVFDAFLQRWFDGHAFTSVTTAQFEAFLNAQLLEAHTPRAGRSVPDVAAWIHAPGVGPGAPEPRSDTFAQVDGAVLSFTVKNVTPAKLATGDWTPHEWLHFLRAIPVEVTPERLAALDRAYGLTKTGNSEVLAQWLELGIRQNYRATDARLESFLVEVGRRKFLMPLYRGLLDVGRRDDATRIYARARSGYHPITQSSLDALLEQKGG
jgi:aminopeptidase N